MTTYALIEDLQHRAGMEDTRHAASGYTYHQENAATMRQAAAELVRLLTLVPPETQQEAPGEATAPGADEVAEVQA